MEKGKTENAHSSVNLELWISMWTHGLMIDIKIIKSINADYRYIYTFSIPDFAFRISFSIKKNQDSLKKWRFKGCDRKIQD